MLQMGTLETHSVGVWYTAGLCSLRSTWGPPERPRTRICQLSMG